MAGYGTCAGGAAGACAYSCTTDTSYSHQAAQCASPTRPPSSPRQNGSRPDQAGVSGIQRCVRWLGLESRAAALRRTPMRVPSPNGERPFLVWGQHGESDESPSSTFGRTDVCSVISCLALDRQTQDWGKSTEIVLRSDGRR